MRRTRNVTVAVSEEGYRQARLWAARHDVSLSRVVAFLLENMADISGAVRMLRRENPNWGENRNN